MKAQIGNLLSLFLGGRNRRRKVSRRDFKDKGLHVLNVRVESKKSRGVRRTRSLLRGGKVILILAGISALALGGKSFVDQIYLKNPTFELGKLFIETDGDLTRAALLEKSGIQKNDNLLDLDLDLVRSRIKVIPQVAHVEVERQLPDIVTIRVQERVPLAWLECPVAGARPHTPDDGWFVDAKGKIFPCAGLEDEYMDLPIIVVDDMPPLIGRMEVDSGQIMDAIEVITLNEERLFHEQLEIHRIDCARDYLMIVTFRNDASVVFGTRDLHGQFDDFAAILAFVKAEDLQIATLNLMVGENKPITFYQAPTSWEEMPILKALAYVPPATEQAFGGSDNPSESREDSMSLDSVVSAPSRARDDGVSSRDRGSDVRAIMGSLYD